MSVRFSMPPDEERLLRPRRGVDVSLSRQMFDRFAVAYPACVHQNRFVVVAAHGIGILKASARSF